MPVEIKGFQELLDTFHDTSKISDTHARVGLKKAAKIVEKNQVEVAQKTHKKYSEDVGWKEIQTFPIRNAKNKKFVSIGLKAKGQAHQNDKSEGRTSHWSKIKGLIIVPI